jgi:crossover junction endodeoxyribonuclease RuvC
LEVHHREGREAVDSRPARQRVLGIDPGSETTGFGVVERSGGGIAHVAHGRIRVPRAGSPALRLARLHAEIRDLIERHRPDVASIEQVFVAASPRSALVLGQARGAALAALGAAGVALVEYTPAHIKLCVCGSGRAGKDQVQRVVARLLALERWPAADAADALAAALCHAQAGRLDLLAARPRGSRRRARGPVVRVRRVS